MGIYTFFIEITSSYFI